MLEEFGLSSEQFQTVFKNMNHAGVALAKIVYDEKELPADFIIVEVNPKFEKIFRVKRQQIILKKPSVFDPEMRATLAEKNIYRSVAKTGISEACEVYFKPQDKWYQVYVYSPKKGYIISMFMDSNERRRAEKRFIESEQWFRRLYETTQDGIMARDTQGRMIDCNQAYAKMLGYSKKELKNISAQQLLPVKLR